MSKDPIETERLVLRELILSDAEGMFELDVNPKVHTFLGNTPVIDKQVCVGIIENIQQQYKDFGIARWAVILKETNAFIGWSGIKYITYEINNHQNFYELGYRFIEKHWGKGYAVEAGQAFVEYAFTVLKAEALYAYVHKENLNSIKVLERLGLHYVNSFEDQGEAHLWYELKNPNPIVRD
jgi:ribosomal-protein-alanine N-acetyltransferase